MAADHVALQLGHVDAVGREAAERLVERGGNILHLEHEGRHQRPRDRRHIGKRLARQHHETRHIMVGVLHPGAVQRQAIKLGRVRRGERGEPDLVAVGDPRRRAGGIAMCDRRDIIGAQPVAALPQRLLVAHRARHRSKIAAHQAVADRQEMLADDRQARFGEQEMDVGDAAVQAVLDRNDRAVDAAFAHGVDRILERIAGHRQRVRVIFARGEVAVRARRALKRQSARRLGERHRPHFVDQMLRRSRIAAHRLPSQGGAAAHSRLACRAQPGLPPLALRAISSPCAAVAAPLREPPNQRCARQAGAS